MSKKTESSDPKALARLNDELKRRQAIEEKKLAGKTPENATEGLGQNVTKREEIECEGCPSTFVSDVIYLLGDQGSRIAPRLCPACLEERIQTSKEEAEEKEAAEALAARRESWGRICPPAYQKTDVARLIADGRLVIRRKHSPETCEETVKRILARPYGPRGFLANGDPRVGKTRLIFKLLERYHVYEGRSVLYTYAPDFSDELAAAYKRSADEANKWLKRMFAVPCWFLDDLGKGILTDRALSAILRVIEHRIANELPIFVTTNHGGDRLIGRLTNEETGQVSEWAEPIVLRLRECCDGARFGGVASDEA